MVKSKNNLQNKNYFNLFLNKYFNVILLSGIMIVFLFSYFFLLGPKFKNTTAVIKENVETQKRLYAEQVKKLNDLNTIKNVYSKISPTDLKKFNGVLPDDYVKEVLFGEFEEMVVQNGFLIKSVSILSNEDEEEAATNDMPEMGVIHTSDKIGYVKTVVAIGAIDYSGFKDMLKVLEVNSRLLDINFVNFSQEANTVDVELVTYFYKPIQ